MQYLVRAIKYFFYFLIVLVLVMTVLVLIHAVEADPEKMFRNGTDSLWQMGAMLVVFGAIYPFFGFTKRETIVPGEYSEIRGGVIKFMESRGYELEKEEGENIYFRQKSIVNKIFRMYEDRISMTRSFSGFTMEGLRKDVIRLSLGLEYQSRNEDIQ